MWRIVDGRAKRIVYEIYRGPDGQEVDVSGVPPRSEFGIEIHIAVGYLVFITGLSIDKTCAPLKFFRKLELSKSQADALLNQLSSQWEDEFGTLCDLLPASAVVHADETSGSINSVWAFLSEQTSDKVVHVIDSQEQHVRSAARRCSIDEARWCHSRQGERDYSRQNRRQPASQLM